MKRLIMQSLISAGLLPAGTLVPTEEESSTTQPFSFYQLALHSVRDRVQRSTQGSGINQ